MRGGRAARRDDRGGAQLAPANEFINGTEQALMELLELNPTGISKKPPTWRLAQAVGGSM